MEEKKQEITKIELLTPLSASFYPDEYGCSHDGLDYSELMEVDSIRLEGEDLVQYEGAIAEGIEQKNDLGDGEVCNLMDYYDRDETIRKKVESAIVSVKQVDGQLVGCTTLLLNEDLEGSELTKLCDYITGQYSDGWGEGFEQRDIQVEGGVLNVHFCSSRGLQVQKQEVTEEQSTQDIEKPPDKKRPKLTLVGQDGNIFSILGRAKRELQKAGMGKEANEMINRATSAGNYYKALNIISEYVETELSQDKPTIPNDKQKKNNQPER